MSAARPIDGQPGGATKITVGTRGAPPPAPASPVETDPLAPAARPHHASPEARAERQRQLADAGARIKADEEAGQEPDAFNFLDKKPGSGPVAAVAAAASGTAPEPIEDVDSVVLRLPNGVEIEYGPTPGESHAFQLARMFQGRASGALIAQNVVEHLLNIRMIDGEKVEPPKTLAEAHELMNRVGDWGFQHLQFAHQKFWPAVNDDRLAVLKKNVRGP